jgi:hypothetical protein
MQAMVEHHKLEAGLNRIDFCAKGLLSCSSGVE